MVAMRTSRPRRGACLCRRCALPQRGDAPRLRQIVRATKGEKLRDLPSRDTCCLEILTFNGTIGVWTTVWTAEESNASLVFAHSRRSMLSALLRPWKRRGTEEKMTGARPLTRGACPPWPSTAPPRLHAG